MSTLYDRTALFLATGAMVGRIPWAPGTWGSLWGFAVYLAIRPLLWPYQLAALLALVALAVFSSQRACELLGDEDPSQVVIDEIAGMSIGLAGISGGGIPLVAAFFLFRFFDIFKPFPVRQLERVRPTGLGVVMDDVAAGVMCNLSWRILEGLHVW